MQVKNLIKYMLPCNIIVKGWNTNNIYYTTVNEFDNNIINDVLDMYVRGFTVTDDYKGTLIIYVIE